MANQNRANLLRLAVEAIDAGGEAAVRVNHLAAAAGVTPPVVYRYFGSRDGLVTAAQVERYSRGIRVNFEPFGQRVAACTTAGELRALLEEFLRTVVANGAAIRWARVDAMGSAYARPDLETAITAEVGLVLDHWTHVLTPCQERGWLRDGIHLPTVVGWLHSLALSRVFVERGPDTIDLERWDELLIESAVTALFGDPPPAPSHPTPR